MACDKFPSNKLGQEADAVVICLSPADLLSEQEKLPTDPLSQSLFTQIQNEYNLLRIPSDKRVPVYICQTMADLGGSEMNSYPAIQKLFTEIVRHYDAENVIHSTSAKVGKYGSLDKFFKYIAEDVVDRQQSRAVSKRKRMYIMILAFVGCAFLLVSLGIGLSLAVTRSA